jgi:hypothetical protein
LASKIFKRIRESLQNRGSAQPDSAQPAPVELSTLPEGPQEAVLKGKVFKNTTSDIIEITEDKVRLALKDFGKRLSPADVIAPLGVGVSLLAVLGTADFKSRHLGLQADAWHAFFIAATVLCAVWLAIALVRRVIIGGHDKATDACVARMKGQTTTKGPRLGQ